LEPIKEIEYEMQVYISTYLHALLKLDDGVKL